MSANKIRSIAKRYGVKATVITTRPEFSVVSYDVYLSDGRTWNGGFFVGETNSPNSKESLLQQFQKFIKTTRQQRKMAYPHGKTHTIAEKDKTDPLSKEQLQRIEAEYMSRMMDTLMDKWGLSMLRARDIGRDLFYTYVFPVYELGGQYGFKAGYTRSQMEASCQATLNKAAENGKMTVVGECSYESAMACGSAECLHAGCTSAKLIIDKSSITDKSNIVCD